MKTSGVEHIGLSVLHLHETEKFFVDVLGFRKLGEKPDYPASFLTDGVTKITLWQVLDPNHAILFDRKNNVGLHHLAFKIEDDEQLDALYQRLKVAPGVVMEFPPESMGQGPSRHMMVTEPGGIRIEFTVRKQQSI